LKKQPAKSAVCLSLRIGRNLVLTAPGRGAFAITIIAGQNSFEILIIVKVSFKFITGASFEWDITTKKI
jgi:hypothetical protein